VLKECADDLAPFLTTIYTKSLAEGGWAIVQSTGYRQLLLLSKFF
jgi:hypothetical protein